MNAQWLKQNRIEYKTSLSANSSGSRAAKATPTWTSFPIPSVISKLSPLPHRPPHSPPPFFLSSPLFVTTQLQWIFCQGWIVVNSQGEDTTLQTQQPLLYCSLQWLDRGLLPPPWARGKESRMYPHWNRLHSAFLHSITHFSRSLGVLV